MTGAGTLRWATQPFILAGREQFARFREWLIASRYTAADIEAQTGVRSMFDLHALRENRPGFVEPVDLQSLLVHLFLDGTAVPWPTVDRLLSPDDRAIVDALGLLQPSVADPSRCVATVALYEVERLYMASDRLPSVEIIGDGIPADIVFSALTKHSREFVERMPRVPCDEYLELCSGAAPAALIAARDFAGHATATDIAERATRFAEFNARLNGIANATMVQGDVYEPVLGKTFDVITAHPPYIPSFDNALVFRDGGEDGEQVVRVILEGLARHLRPGGQFYATCMITSRTGQSVEQRIRSMLGDAQGEFDLLIGVAKAAPPWEMFAGSLRDGTSTPDLYVRRLAAFEALGITEFVAGAFMIQRRATERPVGTRRRSLTPQTTWGDLQWALRYMAATSDWSAENVDVLLDARPCTLPGTRIETRSVLRDGSWNVSAAHLVSSAPFNVKAPCLPWFPPLLSWCDGTATVRELYRRLLGLPEFDRNGTEADFALLLYQLADAPFIELSAIPVVT